MNSNPLRKAALLMAVLALASSACGGSDKKTTAKPAAKSGASVTVTQKEFSLGLSVATVPAGNVRVTAMNAGTIEHELVAFKSDLDETALPLLADKTKIDEAGAGITHFDPEAEHVMPGKSKTITLKLTAGKYVMVCNLPGHYMSGMHAVLNVT